MALFMASTTHMLSLLRSMPHTCHGGELPKATDDMLKLYPECWSIIVEADELMRLERVPQHLRSSRTDTQDGEAFKKLPLRLAVSLMYVFAAADREFWQKHVHDKCLSARTSPFSFAHGRKRSSMEMEMPGTSIPGSGHADGFSSLGHGKGFGKGKPKDKIKGGKGKGKQGSAQNPPGTKRSICEGYQGESPDKIRCKGKPCPSLCPTTNRLKLHICSKCREDHPPPRGAACRR